MAVIRITLLRVIDGDTVEVLRDQGTFRKPGKCRVRLYGIDALESSQKGGNDATKHLRRLIGSKRKIWMTTFDMDQYGRTVGLIYEKRNRPENSYNYMMVRDGQAYAYMTRAGDRERFRMAEEEAKRRRRGMWRSSRSQQQPWEYRKDQRESTARRSRIRLIIVIAAAMAGAALILWLGLSGQELPRLPKLPDIPGIR